MRRRARPAFLVAALCLCTTSVARAEEPAFALTVGPAIRAGTVRGDAQCGISVLADVWFARGPVRLGAATGMLALFGQSQETRTVAPLLLSIAVETMGPKLGFSMRFRGGMWAGATDDGLHAGSMLSGGVLMHYRIDDEISLALGVDLMFSFGHGDLSLFVPALSLVFRPGTDGDDP